MLGSTKNLVTITHTFCRTSSSELYARSEGLATFWINKIDINKELRRTGDIGKSVRNSAKYQNDLSNVLCLECQRRCAFRIGRDSMEFVNI